MKEESVIIFEKLQSQIESLTNMVKEFFKKDSGDKSSSTELNELFTALAKAQYEMPAMYGDKVNPYFKERYVSLGEMISASRTSLTQNGLSVIQQILPTSDGQSRLHTILAHCSGQWISSKTRIVPPKASLHSMNSYITYHKRIAYGSLVGICAVDDDDDGEMADATSRETFAKGVALNTSYNPKENKLEVISKDQLEELEYELSDYPDIAELVLDGLRLQNICDMPKDKYMTSLNRIRRIKALRSGVIKKE